MVPVKTDCCLAYMMKKMTKLHTRSRMFSYFFISDPSHFIKTIRNCFSRGKLWCNGQNIDWQLLIKLYQANTGRVCETPGVSIVHKLNYEHLNLTNFSKMRVDLAVQTLSESVAIALDLTFGEASRETVKFVRHMNHFFDCFNASFFTKGKNQQNCFLSPYWKDNDFQMEYLKELICYLDEWRETVEGRIGFDDDQKQCMLLSAAMDNGIRITVKSFLELVPILLRIDGVIAFLSEKLSQDSIENYLGD